MSDSQASHARKHEKPPATLDADQVKIQFSQEMARAFARLEAHVHSTEQFDFGLLERLQNLATGKPVPAQEAFSDVARIVEGTMRYINATGDIDAENALDALQERLRGYPDPKTFTVLVTKARGRGES